MLKIQIAKIPLQDDDFWNDINTPYINPSSSTSRTKNSTSANLNSFLASNSTRQNLHSQKSVDKRIALYTQSKKCNKHHKRSFTAVSSQCTFHPLLSSNSQIDAKLKDYTKTTIYTRGKKYQQRHLENITKRYKDNELYRFSYMPSVTHVNLTEVFTDRSHKASTDNLSNMLFLYRYRKAREEEEEKKDKVIKDIKRNANIKWKSHIRSLSQKESIGIRKYLHQVLLSQSNIDKDF